MLATRGARDFAVNVGDASFSPAMLEVGLGDRVWFSWTASQPLALYQIDINQRIVPEGLGTGAVSTPTGAMLLEANRVGTFFLCSSASSDQPPFVLNVMPQPDLR